jgi:putative ABC transport system ATP-binding protein
MATVVVRDVHKSFEEGGRTRAVLRGASLTVAAGERVALVGRSGSGKSTLLNLIAGIDRASSGTVAVDGQVLSTMDERARTLFRRARIGFVFQFFNLIPTLTVAENVRLPLELLHGRRGKKAGDDQKVRALLEAVGLDDRREQFPDRLSGGEQQRVALARALVHGPSLVLADEPTGALDAGSGAEVLALLATLAQQNRATVIIVTHSDEVARAADRVVTLSQGLVVERAAGAT